jgi:hypothetical protein
MRLNLLTTPALKALGGTAKALILSLPTLTEATKSVAKIPMTSVTRIRKGEEFSSAGRADASTTDARVG